MKKKWFYFHTKAFSSDKITEQLLEDWSVKFLVEWYASTKSIDADWDVVLPEWIDMGRYGANPIIKRQHKRWDENNIWLVTSYEISDKWLYITGEIILNPEIEAHKTVIHWLRHKLVKWFSIWFIVKEQEIWEMDWKVVNFIKKLEIFEISLVDIPNNPMTLNKALKKIKSWDWIEVEEEENNFVEIEEKTNEEVVEEKEITNEEVVVVEDNQEEVIVEAEKEIVDEDKPVVEEIIEEKEVEEVKTEEVIEENQEEVKEVEVLENSEKEKELVDDVVAEVTEAIVEQETKEFLMDVKIWDIVWFRFKDDWWVYPEMDDKPIIWKVLLIDEEDYLRWWSVINWTNENPIYWLQVLEKINWMYVKTTSFVAELKDWLMFETDEWLKEISDFSSIKVLENRKGQEAEKSVETLASKELAEADKSIELQKDLEVANQELGAEKTKTKELETKIESLEKEMKETNDFLNELMPLLQSANEKIKAQEAIIEKAKNTIIKSGVSWYTETVKKAHKFDWIVNQLKRNI